MVFWCGCLVWMCVVDLNRPSLLCLLPPLQVPTQNYFTNDFGLPLTMKPDFETLSCDMIFGQAPPPLEQDEVYTQGCLLPCSMKQGTASCPKIDTQRQQQQQQLVPDAAAGAAWQASSS